MAVTLSGTIAAVVPSVVPTKSRVTGSKIINKIINGTDRPTLITTSKNADNLGFCKIRPGPVKNAKKPKGNPTKAATNVEARPIYTVSKVDLPTICHICGVNSVIKF